MTNQEKQTVWLTMSKGSHNGYFVWDVMECIGNKEEFHYSLLKQFTPTSDDSYVYIQCHHFWTEEGATEFLEYKGYDQEIVIIP